MPDVMTGTVTAAVPETLQAPEPIYNCPMCSHYLPPGTLACPECQTIIYSGHLRTIALQATTAENEQHFDEAKSLWRQALEWLPPGTKQAEAVNAKIATLDARTQSQDEFKAKWTKRLGPLAPAFFFLVKAKSFLFLLFKAKFLLSFIGFFGIYWVLLGWKFGLGMTLSILTHEMGHYVAAKRRGLKVDLPVFMPGLGAYVRWYSQGVTLDTMSGIALAGPFFGLLFGLVCAGVALVAPNSSLAPLFEAIVHVTAWLNVLNLIPVLGLDGAQATYALDRTQRWLVLATSLIFFGLLHELMFLLVGLGMAWRIWSGGFAEKPSSKTMVQYVLLLFALGLMMYWFPVPARSY
jgi:Zn-dependent protease